MSKSSTEELKVVFDRWFGGSDGRYRHCFNRDFIYTEGARDVFDTAGAHWLADIMATELAPICLRLWNQEEETMLLLIMKVHQGKAELVLARDRDGNKIEGVHWNRVIDYTDFPEGEWMFYLAIDQVVESGRTRVVCLLPSEY
jgi:hypothetical protein